MVLSNATLSEAEISMKKFSFDATDIVNDNCEILGIIAEGDMSQDLQSNV